jgi:hypothetical protein
MFCFSILVVMVALLNMTIFNNAEIFVLLELWGAETLTEVYDR